ncbi:MAG: putative serine/threonine-protein kinase [Satyrvirus sp.]|uniref:Putative serine/threonine-protein kinase n=1 Tax=Satyrvirus sp. TaxID=2487771 RepID=A0A3G5AFY1_9VIRU|nr:MAG: putative serine/threonine-protein kinase [Satyrvirus sp.]
MDISSDNLDNAVITVPPTAIEPTIEPVIEPVNESTNKQINEESLSIVTKPKTKKSVSFCVPLKSDVSRNQNNIQLVKPSHNSNINLKTISNRIEYTKYILKIIKLDPVIDFNNNNQFFIDIPITKINIKHVFIKSNFGIKYYKNKYGYAFKARSKIDKNILFDISICTCPKYSAALQISKLLGNFIINRSTPSIAIPISSFYTKINDLYSWWPFETIDIRPHDDKKNGTALVYISEWCDCSLLELVTNSYFIIPKNFWDVIIFQILFTLDRIQIKYPTFRHNDLSISNIFVYTDKVVNSSKTYYNYIVGNKSFVVPNIGVQVRIKNFTHACIGSIVENSSINDLPELHISSNENKYYDINYFLNTLLLKSQKNNFQIPKEIDEFMYRVVPDKYCVGGKYCSMAGRLVVDDEYTTPYKILLTDPLFNKFGSMKN